VTRCLPKHSGRKIEELNLVCGSRGEATKQEGSPMRALSQWDYPSPTADGALAQNTLLLGRGQPPRQTTMPLTTYPTTATGRRASSSRPRSRRLTGCRTVDIRSSRRARLPSRRLSVNSLGGDRRRRAGREGGRADLDSAAAQHVFAAMLSATSERPLERNNRPRTGHSGVASRARRRQYGRHLGSDNRTCSP
jgi:hypothetical protein